MKVIQEKLPASQVGLEIEVPAEMSRKTYDKVLQNLTRTLKVPGFRPGKVPKQVLIQRFGANAIHSQVIQELIDVAVKEAVQAENIPAIGNYQLKSTFDELVEAFRPGESLSFQAAVDVQPEVTFSTYQGFNLTVEQVQPDPAQVDRTLEEYRQRMATLVPVEGRNARRGDVVVVSYQGRYLPAEQDAREADVPGGSAENFELELEEGKLIPGFIEGIEGMTINESRQIEVKFPEDYTAEFLAGRPAKFNITLHEIKEKELPELDDEFAQEASNGEYETLADLRQMLEQRYQKEADEKNNDNKQVAILNELLQHAQVDLPETLIAQEVQNILMQSAYQLQSQGLDMRKILNQETVARWSEASRPEALLRLKRTLVLGEVGKRENIKVPPEELDAKEQEMWNELGEADSQVDRESLRTALSEDMLKDKILAWVEDHSTIELVPEGRLQKQPAAAPAVEAKAVTVDSAQEAPAASSTAVPVEQELSQPTASAEPEATAEEPTAISEPEQESAPSAPPAEPEATAEPSTAQPKQKPKGKPSSPKKKA
jgi:trigger factor